MLVPKLLFGNALVQKALLQFLHAISFIPDCQFPVLLLHQEYNCISNAQVLWQVLFLQGLMLFPKLEFGNEREYSTAI
jgi:hypothetical protein